MDDHRNRDDLSRYLVHLTRNYGGASAEDNLVSMLRSRKIQARNAHCLFQPRIKNIGFSAVLKRQFNTVCFTEAPLHQLRYLAQDIAGRRIQLRPFGLAFWKHDLLGLGANPAVYINTQAEGLREFLLSEFAVHFEDLRRYKDFRKSYGLEADSIIRYYSLVNIISERIDFSWEREWRLKGHLHFDFTQLVAIIVPDPNRFRRRTLKQFGSKLRKQICRIPAISPDWNYEQLVEELTMRFLESSR